MSCLLCQGEKNNLSLGNSQFKKYVRVGLTQENQIKLRSKGVDEGYGHKIAWVPLGKSLNLSRPWFPYLKCKGVGLVDLDGLL